MSSTQTRPDERDHARLAGVLLAAGALGFVAVFSILAARLGYPEMLDHPAAQVLPALIAGGAGLRMVWAIYAALPITIVVAALLVHRSLPFAPGWNRAFTAAGVLAGIAMTVGLVRWPTLQWALGEQWLATTDGARQAAISARFDALNLWLGNVVGEFVGEVAIAIWFTGLGLARSRSWVGRAALLLAALMLVGAFRNVLPATGLATQVTNLLLPVVMIWLGLAWALGRHLARRPTTAAALHAPV